MADLHKELEYKFKDYPNIKWKMLKTPVFHPFLENMNKEQAAFVEDGLDDNVKLIFVDSKSGSGKTTMATLIAYARYLESKQTQELLYVAAPVQEQALGHTKGTQKEKEEKYMTPLYDALEELNMNPKKVIRDEEYSELQDSDEVWCNTKTHAYVRGSNVKNKTVILDEFQNSTKSEAKKILTRVHDNSLTLVIGHRDQIDLPNPRKSGFVPYIEHFRDEPYVRVHTLHENFRGEVSRKADEFTW